MNNRRQGKTLLPELTPPHDAEDHLAGNGKDDGDKAGDRGGLHAAPSRRGARVLSIVAKRLTSIEGMIVAAEVGIFLAGLIVLLRAL